jgi:DNA-directed RNA polymerase subunit N (RpoN/RPB10)
LDADILNKKKKEEVTAEAKALKELKVNRMCCRTHFLCNVDMIDII